jgi:hypothetical protein
MKGVGISRAGDLFNRKDKKGRLGVGKTKFFEDYVYHPDRPDEGECVPGTDVRRLKPVPLGEKAIGFVDAEVDALIDALVAHRDERWKGKTAATPEPTKPPSGRPALKAARQPEGRNRAAPARSHG